MQSRLRDYQDPIGSFEHNLFNLGLHYPGRYCGYDTIESMGDIAVPMKFRLKHSGTGITYKNSINQVIGPIGVSMTTQGVLVQEDASIEPLQCVTNAGNNQTRYDLIMLTHSYSLNPGGDAATYTVLQGPLGNPIKPVIPDPLRQIAIGVIEIPPNAADISVCKYYKAKCPDSGDGEDARLNTPNAFQAMQLFNKSAHIHTQRDASYTSGQDTASLWQLDNDGNMFEILPDLAALSPAMNLDGIKVKDVTLQEGTRVLLIINEKVTLRESAFFPASSYGSLGYKPFKIPPSLGNINIGNVSGGSPFGVNPSVGEQWTLECVFYNNQWWLITIGGVGGKSAWSRGDTIWWYGDIATNFDANGKGINLKAGWQIHNGLNSTLDARGRGLIQATSVPSAGRPDLTSAATAIAAGLNPDDYIFQEPWTTGGKANHSISQSDLPNCDFVVNDPGHSHKMSVKKADSEGGTRFGYVPNNLGDGSHEWDANTSNDVTGISVSSGGVGTKIVHIQPVLAMVLIMKL
jgi:hypothetical protein